MKQTGKKRVPSCFSQDRVTLLHAVSLSSQDEQQGQGRPWGRGLAFTQLRKAAAAFLGEPVPTELPASSQIFLLCLIPQPWTRTGQGKLTKPSSCHETTPQAMPLTSMRNRTTCDSHTAPVPVGWIQLDRKLLKLLRKTIPAWLPGQFLGLVALNNDLNLLSAVTNSRFKYFL